MKVGERVGRASGNEEIDRNELVQTLRDLRASGKGAARYGAASHGNDHPGFGNRFKGLKEGGFHVPGDWAGHHNAIRVSGRRDKIDSKTRQIEKGGGKNIQVGFAGVASGCGNLSQLQGSSKEFFEVRFRVMGQIGQGAAGQKILFFSHRYPEILGEGDELLLGEGLAGSAENAPAQVDPFSFAVNGVLRAGGHALGDQIRWGLRVDLGPSPVSFVKFYVDFWVWGCPIALFKSVF
jgi:hypothetical protein